VVVPALAGIGAVPQSRASAASLTMRCGLSPGGHQQLRGGLGSDSGDGTGRRRGLGDQVGHLFVGFGDFTVKCLHPPGQPAEHDLRGGGRLTDPGDVGPQPGAVADQGTPVRPGHRGSEPVGCTDRHRMHLVDRSLAGLHRNRPGGSQQPDRLHRAAAIASMGSDLPCRCRALTVRSVHLDDRYLLGMQVPEQTGPVGTGASTPTLTTDPNDSSHDSSCR
jgi:hypothetical protein